MLHDGDGGSTVERFQEEVFVIIYVAVIRTELQDRLNEDGSPWNVFDNATKYNSTPKHLLWNNYIWNSPHCTIPRNECFHEMIIWKIERKTDHKIHIKKNHIFEIKSSDIR